MIFSQGDIIEVSFDPTVGHEPAKRRPAIVVSADDFNVRSSLTVVVPITSHDNGYPLHVRLEKQDEIHGFACVEQLRAVDLTNRHAQFLTTASTKDMSNILNVIGAAFGI